MENKIFDLVTDLLREDINKQDCIDALLLLCNSSLTLEEKIKNKLSEAKKDLIKLRKDTEYMEKDEINWGLEIDFIKYEIAILHNL